MLVKKMAIFKETVCVVMTAFDPQPLLLFQIVERIKTMGVDHIIIIDNGTSDLTLETDSFISIYKTSTNLGTAGGYRLGIDKAIDAGYDYVWLLDDDNLPREDALSVIFSEKEVLESDLSKSKLMLLSNRPHLLGNIFLHKNESVYSIAPKVQSYLGFHYSQVFEIMRNRLFGKKPRLWADLSTASSLAMDSAYYGGLFFHKSVTENYSPPNRGLFIYWDDMDFANRFYSMGGSVYLILDSIVEDLSVEREKEVKRNFFHHPFIDLEPRFKAFYYIRNLNIYERRWSNSFSVTYQFNKALLLMILFIITVIRRRKSRFSLLLKSVRCGKRFRSE